MYLASYFAGGLAGAAIVGRVFETGGWTAAVATIGVAIAIAVTLSRALDPAAPSPSTVVPTLGSRP